MKETGTTVILGLLVEKTWRHGALVGKFYFCIDSNGYLPASLSNAGILPTPRPYDKSPPI
jgi:hypothetical protein